MADKGRSTVLALDNEDFITALRNFGSFKHIKSICREPWRENTVPKILETSKIGLLLGAAQLAADSMKNYNRSSRFNLTIRVLPIPIIGGLVYGLTALGVEYVTGENSYRNHAAGGLVGGGVYTYLRYYRKLSPLSPGVPLALALFSGVAALYIKNLEFIPKRGKFRHSTSFDLRYTGGIQNKIDLDNEARGLKW